MKDKFLKRLLEIREYEWNDYDIKIHEEYGNQKGVRNGETALEAIARNMWEVVEEEKEFKRLEQYLGLLAMRFRGNRNKESREQVAKEYAETVDKLIASGDWKEMPVFEEQLTDEYMPNSFFKYWRIR